MAQIQCPLCGVRSSARLGRCQSCGADFHDPDVRAMMDDSAGGGAPLVADLGDIDGAGALQSSKVLGVEAESIDRGDALAKLAGIGALLLLGGFLVPVAPDYRNYAFPWELKDAPLATWLTPVAALLGVGLLAIRPPAKMMAHVLAVVGLLGVALSPALGRFGAAPFALTPLLTIGLAVTGAAAIQRLYEPEQMMPRYALIAGAALTLVGMLIPVSDPMALLSAEMRFASRGAPESSLPLLVWYESIGRNHLTFFVGIFAVLPAVIAPAAAALAWPVPKVWDHLGLGLRPLAWLLVLYGALQMALGVFNMMGWDDIRRVVYDGHVVLGTEFTQAGMVGRVKVMLLSAAYGLWASFGLVAIYRVRSTRPGPKG